MSRWPSIEDRLLSRIVESSEGCLLFIGPKTGNGYGVIGYEKRQDYVHRVVWKLNNGPIKEGYCVLHTCDNPACCNIDHLLLGSHKDNTQDMMRKGRHVKPSYRVRSLVDPIFDLHNSGLSNSEVANHLGISRTSVHHVVHGKRWKSDMALYNLRTALDDYRITKFTPDLEVESSYIISPGSAGGLPECTCPAGTRPTCRHRQMWTSILPLVDTQFFWDFDHNMIVDSDGDQVTYLELEEALATMPDGAERDNAIETALAIPPLPAGVTVVSLDEPVTLHNAIADAVGEPALCEDEGCPQANTPHVCIAPSTPWRRI